MSLVSLLLLIAPDEYLEKDSKAWTAATKQALVAKPELMYFAIVIGSVDGGTLQVLDRLLEKNI